MSAWWICLLGCFGPCGATPSYAALSSHERCFLGVFCAQNRGSLVSPPTVIQQLSSDSRCQKIFLKHVVSRFPQCVLPAKPVLCVSCSSCLTLCDPMNCSPPGSPVHGILQARVLAWVAIFSFRDLPDPGIKPASPASSGRFFTAEPPGKPIRVVFILRTAMSINLGDFSFCLVWRI